jgi:hypothetical protein
MFSLTLHDHLRLIFTQISQRQKTHAQSAHSDARRNRWLRGGEALLMGGVSIAAVAAAFSQNRVFIIVAAVLAGAALIILIIHLTFDFENSAHAHVASSADLWRIRERYRSLLSDLQDGVVDLTEARLRRDKLIDELGTIYDKASGLAPADDSSVVEEDAELFAPKALHGESAQGSPH